MSVFARGCCGMMACMHTQFGFAGGTFLWRVCCRVLCLACGRVHGAHWCSFRVLLGLPRAWCAGWSGAFRGFRCMAHMGEALACFYDWCATRRMVGSGHMARIGVALACCLDWRKLCLVLGRMRFQVLGAWLALVQLSGVVLFGFVRAWCAARWLC